MARRHTGGHKLLRILNILIANKSRVAVNIHVGGKPSNDITVRALVAPLALPPQIALPAVLVQLAGPNKFAH